MSGDEVIESFIYESSAVRVHLLLKCEGCDWSISDYKGGDIAAKMHATNSGHIVKGEYGFAVEIQP